jgi:hypothetical protein
MYSVVDDVVYFDRKLRSILKMYMYSMVDDVVYFYTLYICTCCSYAFNICSCQYLEMRGTIFFLYHRSTLMNYLPAADERES